MDLKYKSYIIYVEDLESKFNKNPLAIIPDFLANDMQIILGEKLFFTEIVEHISPKEWFGQAKDIFLEDYDVFFYHIDFVKPSQTNYIYMSYDDETGFYLGYSENAKNKDYLCFVLLYNFARKMLLLRDIEIESFENTSYKNYIIKTETDIALFLDDNISLSELYGFEKNSDIIKYLAVPYTDAIKIKGFPKEWLI